MSSFNEVVVLVAAVLGAFWGWRVGTKRIYRRSVFAENADDSGKRRWRRRRTIQRYWITVLYAAAVAGGIALLMMLAKR